MKQQQIIKKIQLQEQQIVITVTLRHFVFALLLLAYTVIVKALCQS